MKHTMRYYCKRVLSVALTLCMALSLTVTGVRADSLTDSLTDGVSEADTQEDTNPDMDIQGDDTGDADGSDVEGVPYGADPETDGYVVTVSADKTEGIQPGDTVSLTATVTYGGEEITDLKEAGLYLWWWTDVWAEGHTDGLNDAVYSNYDDGSGNSLTADVTLPNAGTYYIAAELQDSDYMAVTDKVFITLQVEEAAAELADIPLENGDFENGVDNWTLSGFSSVGTDECDDVNPTNTLGLWLSDSEETKAAAAYTVTLTAGSYQFGFELSGDEADSGLAYAVKAGEDTLVSGSGTYTTAGFGNWTKYATELFTLTEETEITFALSGTVPAGYWGNLDNLTLKGTGNIAEEDTSVEADINVKKIPGLSEDFMMGMDISSVISEFNSGVTYKDFEGNTIDNITDFCLFLKKCGVTDIRVRIWNDPYDADGNGYGGGNNDISTAVKIAQGCAAAGLGMLLDFHCSDFWTDPGKQQAPKGWADYTVEQKAEALESFLTEALTEIRSTGAEIAMVQVGNETTGGFIGESTVADMCTLFNAGASAIRKFDQNIKVVIHITNPEKGAMTTWAKNLDTNNVDYDVLATSYYPSWHGTFANLKSQLQAVQDTYGKEVMVAETSYAFTLDETDGHENTIRSGNNDTMMCETQYPFTPQGQASYLRDLMAAVSEAGGLGVFYWESAWISVGDVTGLTGEDYDAQVEKNKAIWEKYGSGWASSYSAQYDPDDAGKWYGGSAVDNQAMFYADGSPVPGINVWKLVRTGAVSNDVAVDSITNVQETIEAGGGYTLPETVTVTYNSGAAEEPVQWDETDAIDVSVPGTYVVNGTVTFSKEVTSGDYAGQKEAPVTYTLTVKAPNLIGDDWSFENGSGHFSGLESTGKGIDGETSYDGDSCLHWYLAEAGQADVRYCGADSEGITLEPGNYTFECTAQGYDGDTVALAVLNHGTDEEVAEGDAVLLEGWKVWKTPSVSFTITETTVVDLQLLIDIQAGGWGTLDCMYLYRTGDIEEQHEHSYGAPVFRWAEDYSACNAVFTCEAGDDEQTESCDVSSEIAVAPTETEEGQLVYTAAVTFNGQSYTDTKTAAIPATGSGHEHSYGAPVFTWSEDYSTCEAVFTCEAGDDEQTIQCDVTSKTTVAATKTKNGKIVYTATVSFNGKTYTDTKTVTVAATGDSQSDSADGSKSSANTVRTGDTSRPLLWGTLGVLALAVILILFAVRRRSAGKR